MYENADRLLVRDEMPVLVKKAAGGKRFSQILNNLGFKGPILKTFFPKRGKSELLFRKTVSTDQLQKEGVKVSYLLQELRTAHAKNSPK